LYNKKVPSATKDEGEASDPTTLTLKGHLFELTIGKAIRGRAGGRSFAAGIGGKTLKNWTFKRDLSDNMIQSPCWFLLLTTGTNLWDLTAAGLGLVQIMGQAGKYERIGYVVGAVEELQRSISYGLTNLQLMR